MKENRPEAPLRVSAAIAAVMNDLGEEGITKTRRNKEQGYSFRGIDDVYNALSRLLSKHKLFIVPHFHSREMFPRQTKSGGFMYNVVVSGEFELVSAEDGSRIVSGPFFGEAQDTGDKATNKAMSAAFKYMAMQVFCIPTEGDNDADSQSPEETAPAQSRRQMERRPEDDEPGDPRDAPIADGPKQRTESIKTQINAANSLADIDKVMMGKVKTLQTLKEKYPLLYEDVQSTRSNRIAFITQMLDDSSRNDAGAEFDDPIPF